MNRHHLLPLAFGIISVFTLGPTPAEAQNDFHALYNRYRFHQVGYSARSAAMGGAYSALQDNENTLVGNPASLGFLQKPFISAGFDRETVASDLTLFGSANAREGEAEMWNINFGGAYPFEWGAVGLQYGYRWDDISTDTFPPYFGLFREQEGDLDRHYGGLGVGYKMMDGLAMGYRFAYIDYEYDWSINRVRPGGAGQLFGADEEFSGHRHQFGVQYQPSEMIVLGLDGFFALGDRDSNAMGNADADSYAVRGGIAWSAFEDIPLLLALDINYETRDMDGTGVDSNEDLVGIHFGIEYEVYENLFLRAGYQFEDIDFKDTPLAYDESFSYGGYSAGIGYKYNQINFDYAFMYLDTGSGDTAHYFGIGYEF